MKYGAYWRRQKPTIKLPWLLRQVAVHRLLGTLVAVEATHRMRLRPEGVLSPFNMGCVT
jgi:hypothetical protein